MPLTHLMEANDGCVKTHVQTACVQRKPTGRSGRPGGLMFYFFSLALQLSFPQFSCLQGYSSARESPPSVALSNSSHSGYGTWQSLWLWDPSPGWESVPWPRSCSASWEVCSRPPFLCIESVDWRAASGAPVRMPRMAQEWGLLQARFKIGCNQTPLGERPHSNFSSSFSVV